MSDKTVAQKARVKPGTGIAVINRVPGIVESLGLPRDVAFATPAKADLVFLFVRTRAELNARMPRAVAALGPAAALWVFFRKGSGGAGLDMNRDTVWAVAERLEMRPLGIVSVNDGCRRSDSSEQEVKSVGNLSSLRLAVRCRFRGHRGSW